MELRHMRDPNNQQIMSSLFSVRSELQAIIHNETAFALYRLCRKHFDCGDKAEKMLALQLKQLETKQCIPAVKNTNGTVIKERSQICNAFRDYYSDLYQSECSFQGQNLEKFLKSISFPVLKAFQVEDLESPITTKEIVTAVKSLASGKSPGGDGFTSEFYKGFAVELSPLLIRLYNDMIQTETSLCQLRALAYNARFAAAWGYDTKAERPNWVWLEEQIIKCQRNHISLSSLWYCPKDIPGLENPVITGTINIVTILHKKLAMLVVPSPLAHNGVIPFFQQEVSHLTFPP